MQLLPAAGIDGGIIVRISVGRYHVQLYTERGPGKITISRYRVETRENVIAFPIGDYDVIAFQKQVLVGELIYPSS